MKRFLPLLLALLGSVATAVAASAPGDFTRAFVGALQKADPTLGVKIVGDLELSVRRAGKADEETFFLNNAYETYQRTPASGHDIIAHYVTSLLESRTGSATPLDVTRIVPIVKDRAWLDEIRQATKGKSPDGGKITQVWERYNDELVIVYAEDSPKSVRYFGADDLAKTGLKPAELRVLAVKNLRTVVPGVEVHVAGPLYIVTADGAYEASLLLADPLWTDGKIKVKGEVVVAIPARDTLLATGSKDADGLAKLRQVTDKIYKAAPYRLTPQFFVFRDGKFVRFRD